MKRLRMLLSAGEIRADYADAGDIVRVLSCMFVAWFHIWQQSWLNPDAHFYLGFRIYPLVACGYMFVDIMLLLSGFLLMLGYLSGRSRDVRSFYTARAARILPSYLLCILVGFFVFALPGKLYWSSEQMLTDILSHLSFTHTFFYDGYIGTKLNGALWTLAIEMQFYLIFPLVARAFRKKPLLGYLVMLLVGFASRVSVASCFEDTSMYFNQLPCMMDVYANGMLAATIYQKLAGRKQRAWGAWLSTLLSLACAFAIYKIFSAQYYASGLDNVRLGQMHWRFMLTALAAAFLVCASRSIAALRTLWRCKLLRVLSSISFNFYIWHTVVLLKLKQWRIPYYEGENPNQAGLQPWQEHYTLLSFFGSLALAALTTYLIERPCARAIKRPAKQKKTHLRTCKP